ISLLSVVIRLLGVVDFWCSRFWCHYLLVLPLFVVLGVGAFAHSRWCLVLWLHWFVVTNRVVVVSVVANFWCCRAVVY
ncbi:1188_t:CDS:2, partial [Gigaspora rosea]